MVLPKNIDQAIQLRKDAAPEEQHEQRRIQMLGQMFDMILTKSERFNMPLPPDLERANQEIEAHGLGAQRDDGV